MPAPYNQEASERLKELMDVTESFDLIRLNEGEILRCIQANADPCTTTSEGTPLLHWLMGHYMSSLVEAALEAGANPNDPDQDGNTALICLVTAPDFNNDRMKISELCRHSQFFPDATITNHDGKTATDIITKKIADKRDLNSGSDVVLIGLEEVQLTLKAVEEIADQMKEGKLSLSRWREKTHQRFPVPNDGSNRYRFCDYPWPVTTAFVIQQCQKDGTITLDEMLEDDNMELLRAMIPRTEGRILEQISQQALREGKVLTMETLSQKGVFDEVLEVGRPELILQPCFEQNGWPGVQEVLDTLSFDAMNRLSRFQDMKQFLINAAGEWFAEQGQVASVEEFAPQQRKLPPFIKEALYPRLLAIEEDMRTAEMAPKTLGR